MRVHDMIDAESEDRNMQNLNERMWGNGISYLTEQERYERNGNKFRKARLSAPKRKVYKCKGHGKVRIVNQSWYKDNDPDAR